MSITLGASFWWLLPLLSAHPSSACGLSHSPSVSPSTVAPSSSVQSATLGKTVPKTCSLVSRSWQAIAPSIWICGIPLPTSKPTSSQAPMQVHFRGIPNGLPGPLSPHPLTLGFADPKVDRIANWHQDSWTWRKAISKPGCKPAWAHLASPIPDRVISSTHGKQWMLFFDCCPCEPLPSYWGLELRRMLVHPLVLAVFAVSVT